MKNGGFHTTHWSVISRAKGEDSSAKSALGQLCEMYYQPVLYYIERAICGDATRQYGGRDARDLTHDFFVRLLEGGTFKQLKQQGTRFRSYLLGSVKHFLGKIREKELTIKRGGQHQQVPLQDNLQNTVAESENQEDLVFDRDWAKTLLEKTIALLDQSPKTQCLFPWLTRQMNAEDRTRLAQEFGLSDTAIKVSLHRLRKQFRETIRAKIAETVVHESEIDEELTHLIAVLRVSLSLSPPVSETAGLVLQGS